jgi:hypothetical protein
LTSCIVQKESSTLPDQLQASQVMDAVVSRKIRGTRKEGTRGEPPTTNLQAGIPYVDDGLRAVQVESCEYRLTDSEKLARGQIFSHKI